MELGLGLLKLTLFCTWDFSLGLFLCCHLFFVELVLSGDIGTIFGGTSSTSVMEKPSRHTCGLPLIQMYMSFGALSMGVVVATEVHG